MFEDATFESAGRIHTRSRRWMIAAIAFEAALLLAIVILPLLWQEALPRPVIAFLLDVPAAPQAQQPLPQQPAAAAQHASMLSNDQFFAPRKIPHGIPVPDGREEVTIISMTDGNSSGDVMGGVELPTFGPPLMRVVHPAVKNAVRVTSAVEEGLLLHKTIPVYPAIGRAAGVEGTVMLAATISKTGIIENLRVTSGPPMLRQAALDAVQSWRYRPYVLDGQPVEVETTIDVIFTLGR
jgi:protein TonB